MQPPELKLGLFGYTPESVRLILADRDTMFTRASEQARAAEALVLKLRSEAGALKTQLEEQVERLRALEAEARTYLAVALVPERSPATNDFSFSLGPVISGDPSCCVPGRRGT